MSYNRNQLYITTMMILQEKNYMEAKTSYNFLQRDYHHIDDDIAKTTESLARAPVAQQAIQATRTAN